MEVSKFMSEQLHAPMALLDAQRQQIEQQREAYESKLERQRDAYEVKLEAQRKAYELKLDDQRQQIEELRHSHDANDSRRAKIAAFQARLDLLYNAKLLADDELCAIEDKVADAIGAAHTDGEDNSAWACVMQMIQLSEGIVSEKMFSRQLRRKFA